ncbi:Uncharacterised protein [Vibrio cholerae]|nr:Uncharacterised protein [Vibrio cholerae]
MCSVIATKAIDTCSPAESKTSSSLAFGTLSTC